MKRENKKVYILTKTYNGSNTDVLGVYEDKDALFNDLNNWLSEYYIEQTNDEEDEYLSKDEYIENIIDGLKECDKYYEELFDETFFISAQDMNTMY